MGENPRTGFDKIARSDFGLRRKEQPEGAFAGANDQSRPNLAPTQKENNS